MSRLTTRQVDHAIELSRWLYWNALRRSSKYRLTLATLLSTWRRDSNLETQEHCLGGIQLERRRGRVAAVKGALQAYKSLKTRTLICGPLFQGRFVADVATLKAHRPFVKNGGGPGLWAPTRLKTEDVEPISKGKRAGGLPRNFYLREQELMMVIQEAEDAHRWFRIGVKGTTVAKRLSSGTKIDGLPELDHLRDTFGVRFPIPPSVGMPLEDVMVATSTWPARRTLSQDLLKLEIHSDVGPQIALGFIGGALFHHLEKNKPTTSDQPKYSRKLVSRKSGKGELADIIRVERFGDNWIRLSIHLHKGKLLADKRAVMAAIRRQLPRDWRSKASFRSRDFYAQVFLAMDLRRRLTQERVGQVLFPDYDPRDAALKVKNLENTYRRLALQLGIPV